ncbi:hypothetical protein HPB50_022486 [Hyalomma asiaticum]|uniref:Uncharacterized protein n=1 Tax=Hyalomma asiaticum TaxID=266040 RepID=A0ACB7S1G0_HYAAI|nr:hypothetical protein HPB50_022486 [Hyalomma asiaticum]
MENLATLGHSALFKTKAIKDSEKNVLIATFGYPVQEFTVTTEDSYDIMIQRIPHGRVRTPVPWGGKPVAFLMTGLLCSSADFVVNMPDQSLGFILADHGFDVWLGNVRGNCYSKHHFLKTRQKKYWDFSFDEMIKYDLPAQIDMILHETRRNWLLYLGWSQGSLIMFGLLSSQPQYNQKVRLFNAMAPVAFLGHMTSYLKRSVPFGGFLRGVFQMTLNGAFMAKKTIISKKLAKKVCKSYWQGITCKTSFKIMNGGLPIEMNLTRFPVYMANTPAGSSVRNIYHFAQCDSRHCHTLTMCAHSNCSARPLQIIKANRLQHFDWGPIKNKIIYGQKEAPKYDLKKVTAPVALYWSDGDVLVCPQDVTHLKRMLPNVVLSYKVPVHGFTHIDFAWSILAKNHLYKKILQMMIEYSRIESPGNYYSPMPQKSQLITSFGYPVQEFTVTTEDSYDIMIQRIPHGRVQTPPPLGGKPIAFLMTGVLSSSADFVVNMPDQSLGFILADHGFDVWLGNVRGTIYSKHVSLKKSQRKFWDFSFDEMIKYDLPAQIDTVLHETKKNSLLYVGWSQGTIILFGLLATKPHYNDKVRLFNAMGPAPYLGNMEADVTRMLPFSGLLKTRLPVYMANDPAGTSVRNILHIGQREPPEYDLRKVTAPVALYWSDGDVLTCAKDVRLLEMILPNVVLSYKVPVPGFTHIDFAWSIKAKDHLYKVILQMMIKYSGIEPRVSHYSPWPQGGYY